MRTPSLLLRGARGWVPYPVQKDWLCRGCAGRCADTVQGRQVVQPCFLLCTLQPVAAMLNARREHCHDSELYDEGLHPDLRVHMSPETSKALFVSS